MKRNCLFLALAFVLALFAPNAEADRDEAEAHFERGNELNRSGRKEEALKEFLEAVRLNPKHDWANYALGYMYFYDRSDYGEALKWFERHIQYYPDSKYTSAANFQICKIYLKQKELERATKFCDRALILDGSDAAVTHTQARLLSAKKRYAEAEKFFRRTLELNPLYGEALWNLGGVYYEQNRADEAMKIWDEAAKICASGKKGVVCSDQNSRWSRMHQAGCIPGTNAMKKPECQRSFE